MEDIIWVPRHPPPDPSSVSGLSTDAEIVLKALLKRQQHRRLNRRQYANNHSTAPADYYKLMYRRTFGSSSQPVATPCSMRNLKETTPISHCTPTISLTQTESSSLRMFDPETPLASYPKSQVANLQHEYTNPDSQAVQQNLPFQLRGPEGLSGHHNSYQCPPTSLYQGTHMSCGDKRIEQSYYFSDNAASQASWNIPQHNHEHQAPLSSVVEDERYGNGGLSERGGRHQDSEEVTSFNASQSLFSTCSSQDSMLNMKPSQVPNISPPLDLSPDQMNERILQFVGPDPRLSPNHSAFKTSVNIEQNYSTEIDDTLTLGTRASALTEMIPEASSNLQQLSKRASDDEIQENSKKDRPRLASSISRRLGELKKLQDAKPPTLPNDKALMGNSTPKASNGSKKQKISHFKVPVKKQTFQNAAIATENTDSTATYSTMTRVSSLNQDDRQVLASQLTCSDEVALTLVYQDGSSQLREHVASAKKASAPENSRPSGLAVAYPVTDSTALTQSNAVTLYFVLFSLDAPDDQWTRDTLNEVMTSSSNKLCFDCQELVNILVKVYSYDASEVILRWGHMLDPLVAVWLIDPDHPAVTFKQTLASLDDKLQQGGEETSEREVMSDLALLGPAFLQLYHKLHRNNLWELYTKLDMPLCPVLALMELRGIHMDTDVMIRSADIVKRQMKKLEEAAHEAAGHSFLISSHPQLRQVLFDELKLDLKLSSDKKLARTSKSHLKSTSEGVLQQLVAVHPLPGLVLQYRQLHKLKCTYMDSLLGCVTEGLLFTHWDLTSAATGRLASHNPNLQAVPKQPTTITTSNPQTADEEDVVEEVHARAAFISAPHHSLVTFDFQQIELRIVAHLTMDPVLLQLFNQPADSDADIFTQLSSEWLGKPLCDVSITDREQTKRIVYSVMYGVGKDKLGDYLKTSANNAKAIMSSFLVRYPCINRFTKETIETTRSQGFQTSIFKRRRYFPHIKSTNPQLRAQSERQAVNFRVQGSAADICKAAMLKVELALARSPTLRTRILLQIHDELLLEAPDDQLDTVIELVRGEMEKCTHWGQYDLALPITVSVSVGKSWSAMTPYRPQTVRRESHIEDSPDFICDNSL